MCHSNRNYGTTGRSDPRATKKFVLRAQGRFDALDQPLPLGRGGRPLLEEDEGAKDGRYGCITAVSFAGEMPASRTYSDCKAALIARGGSDRHLPGRVRKG